MGIPLDELQIDIVVNSENAASGIKTLATNLRDLGSAGKTASSGLTKTAQDIGNLGSSTTASHASLRKTAEAIQSTGASASVAKTKVNILSRMMNSLDKAALSATSALGGLLASFKRIAMYRLLRSAIRAVTTAFKEGIQALVEWDYTFGNNTSHAVQTMTELKSTIDLVKRTLGAMAMPIIQILMPAFRALADIVIGLANAFNMFFRALQGETDYMRAVYQEVSAVTDETKKATGAAKELQRVLFGFDELNILPDENGRKGYGGLGALDINPNPGFVPTKIGEGAEPGSLEDFVQAPLNTVSTDVKSLFGKEGFFVKIFTKPEEAGQQLKEGWEQFGNDMEKSWETLNETTIQPAWSGINSSGTAISKFIHKIPVLGQIWGLLEDIFSGRVFTGQYWKNVWSGFTGWVETAGKDISGFFEGIRKDIDYWLGDLFTAEFWQGIGNDIDSYIIDPVLKFLGMREDEGETENKESTHDFSNVNWKTKLKNDIKEINATTINPGFNINTKPLKLVKDDYFHTKDDIEKTPMNPKFKIQEVQIEQLKKIPEQLSKGLSPITLLFQFNTRTLPSAMAYIWDVMQKAFYKSPLTMPTVISNSTQQTFAGKAFLQSTRFAAGGVPDVGTLFWAGESGAEVVANANGRTQVLNTDQMSAAIASGNIDVVNAIYAMSNMVVNAVNSKNFDIYMDSAKVGKSVTTYQNNQARRGLVQGAM